MTQFSSSINNPFQLNSAIPAIISTVTPNYNAGISKTTKFTADRAGVVCLVQNQGSYYGDAYVLINGKEVWRFSGSSSNSSSSASFIVSAGDAFNYVLASGNYAVKSIILYPYRGN